jgi:DNA repair exonuclease SbcCD ATPase subunit
MSSSGPPFRVSRSGDGGNSSSSNNNKQGQSPRSPSPLSSNKKRKLLEDDDRFISQQHLAEVLADLERERAMRGVDRKRAEMVQARLAAELEAARRASDAAESLLGAVQADAERSTARLREERQAAFAKLQRARGELARLQQSSRPSPSSDGTSLWKEKARMLQEQVDAQAEREAQLLGEVERVREAFRSQLAEASERAAASEAAAAAGAGAAEEAPTALMRELNQTRIRLAEAERQVRQLQHKNEGLDKRVLSLVREQEEAGSARSRAAALEKTVRDLQAKHEEARAQAAAWIEFGDALMRELGAPGGGGGGEGRGGAPPEVATVLRHMDAARGQASGLKREGQRKDQRIEFLAAALEETKDKLGQAREQLASQASARAELQHQADAHLLRIETVAAQKAILEREMASLRELVKTFDGMPLQAPSASSSPPGDDVLASPKLETSLKTLQVRLRSVQDELDLARGDRDRAARELEAARAEAEARESELAEVRGKFGKLRDAWQAERARAAQAEERADAAEALAGKGSFNPDKIRALHLRETPLVESLREELAALKRRLEESEGEAADQRPSSSSASTVDLEKATQRLKENFKGQISLFREGVYLMTGYKIELLPGTDRPTFRVRSVFAEREGDQLLLRWPRGEQVTSLDVLDTDLAKELAATPSYGYMSKFHSLPAFLASVQLSLFEKQTVMM